MSKQQSIVSMFDSISGTYDKVNRILSFGIDKSWRKKACKKAFELTNKNRYDILDMACGTGDMIDFWRKSASKQNKNISSIIGIDPSLGMLEIAQKKFPKTEFKNNNATEFDDKNKDIISISYGLRNVVQRQAALKHFYNALNEDGVLVILEFMKMDKKSLMSHIRGLYMNKILPFIGGVISMNFKAYKYLPNSIGDFITTNELKEELEKAGFKIVFTKGYSGDISTLVIAQKNER
ncbi:MAG: Ubiquinone/menaquinone biosynthesis C-methyltransferase UbiE [uncultured Campylobacterales bacterium]|uniref:Demethylmenaquinone methyltransferase n=1 Tax=uncultured Campylobacterales bacterium TaxID=352960 RepID=A0A6S6SI73_9BACT|nr:MAG: Ubiquinone/menaquinone biosynthesis C-methyltransferase UbiE [uncultured Campylobacterales bacterium]